MRYAILTALIAMSIPSAAADEGAKSITYDVVRVEGKLFLEVEPKAQRLSVGEQAVSGDRLRTGSSSSAAIGVASHTTVFRLQAKTSCTLAHERPGVLLHLERGRIRALFGSYLGTDPRLVTTPSAVLAVRGTEYGLRVKKNGDTELVVFKGVVEVIDPSGEHPPIRVQAGQQSRIKTGRPAKAPTPHRLTTFDWDQGRSSPPPGMGAGGSTSGSQSGTFGASGAGAEGNQGGGKKHGG
jgi:FecR protein